MHNNWRKMVLVSFVCMVGLAAVAEQAGDARVGVSDRHALVAVRVERLGLHGDLLLEDHAVVVELVQILLGLVQLSDESVNRLRNLQHLVHKPKS